MKWIVGTGTGRCGTTSLANLLKTQGICTFQEAGSPIGWHEKNPVKALEIRRETLNKLCPNSPYICDVAHYLLNHVPTLVEHFNAKVIILERDRSAMINSWINWTKKFIPGTNRWMEAGKPDEWDFCFPTFHQAENMMQALGMYWDVCHELTQNYIKRYPNRVRVWPTKALNNNKSIMEILDFAEISKRRQIIIPSHYAHEPKVD